MTIKGAATGEQVSIGIIGPHLVARLSVETPDGMEVISLDSNHLQALEAAVRAARLELDARAVSP